MGILLKFMVFFIASCIFGVGFCDKIFNVIDFGAVGDGVTDDSKAFLKAWQALCEDASAGGPTLLIPKKPFLLQPVEFNGPCKSSSVHIQVWGTIVAPKTLDAWADSSAGTWLTFKEVSNLIIDGQGKFNGRGRAWWAKVGDGKNNGPTALHFNKCDGLRISNLRSTNSPRNHFAINDSDNVTLSRLTIVAPDESPNTDGIDIASSSHVNILDSFIGTGDDCVAINGESANINIQGVNCGPGHGISVGSLGRDGAHDTVEKVRVKDCTFNRTQNGARIKTWQGGKGYAKEIVFENINFISSRNPIIIDQNYCNGEDYCRDAESAVAVSDVTYRNIRGTSATDDGIIFNCSKTVPCSGIRMDRVHITSSATDSKIAALCDNIRGQSLNTVPSVPCFSM